jgi:hypothetical protein
MSQRMRIAQLLPYDAGFHGGVREVVVHLSRQLDRLGHETTIFGPPERSTLDLYFPRPEPIRTNPVVLPAMRTRSAACRPMPTCGRTWPRGDG